MALRQRMEANNRLLLPALRNHSCPEPSLACHSKACRALNSFLHCHSLGLSACLLTLVPVGMLSRHTDMPCLKEAAAPQLQLTAHRGPVLLDSLIFHKKLDIQI